MRWLFEVFGFVAIAVSLTAVAEWQNNVVMNVDIRGWDGYVGTLIINAFLGLFAYSLFWWLRKRYAPPVMLFAQYVTWGIFGLAFEWILLGHVPGSGAVQISMFTYWAGVFTTPALFFLPIPRAQRIRVVAFSGLVMVAMLVTTWWVLGQTSNDEVWLLVILAGWFVLYTGLLQFIARAGGSWLRAWEIGLIGLVVPLVEMNTQPFNFFIFIAIFVYIVVAVRGRYQSNGREGIL